VFLVDDYPQVFFIEIRIDGRGFKVLMAKKLLDITHVASVKQHMRCARMPIQMRMMAGLILDCLADA
jgi:hypothetical protein